MGEKLLYYEILEIDIGRGMDMKSVLIIRLCFSTKR